MATDSDSFALIIFGITGNLAQIKLIPALYDMAESGLLPENISIIGTARRELSDEAFKDYFHETLHQENKHHKHEIKTEVVKKLLQKISYLQGNLDDPNFYIRLNDYLKKLTKRGQKCNNKIFYLATYPELYSTIFENLKNQSLDDQSRGWVRVMIEKPIGTDLKSAQELNRLLLEYFKDDQVYRLDHYLGKETLQNILAFRFGNGLFEPLMNNQFVDHIQITASEDYGIGDRGGYFDKVGMLKDVGQNHSLQMLAFVTMDSPKDLSNRAITDERIKILKCLKPAKAVFGQYDGYLGEKNVEPESTTDTFFAFKCQIENKRWKGVPVYIRAGKKLEKTITEIAIVFKTPINRLVDDLKVGEEPNILIFRIYPNEGIILKFLAKDPGSKMKLNETYMQFCYKTLSSHLPDAYEQLLSDTIRGDQTFFNDAEEVEAQWAFTDHLSRVGIPTVYKNHSWGPPEADELIKKDGREWLTPSMEFCAL